MMPGKYIPYELIYKKESPKARNQEEILFSIHLYSILVLWNEDQPLNTFSRDFLLNQIGYEHSGYGDIVFGDDKVTSKDTESALRCLMVW